MANIPSEILSEQQMRIIQGKAHDLFLQLKEQAAWERYCSIGDNIQKTKKNVKWAEGLQPNSAEAVDSLQTMTKSPVSNASTPDVKRSSVHNVVRPVSSVIKNRSGVKDVIAEDINFIKSKLSCLQSDLSELKKMRMEQKNNWDDYGSELLKKNKLNNSLGRTISLREALQSSLANIEEQKRLGKMQSMEKVNIPQTSKGIRFQIPYVLKEHEALSSRLRGRSKPKSSTVNRKCPRNWQPPVAHYSSSRLSKSNRTRSSEKSLDDAYSTKDEDVDNKMNIQNSPSVEEMNPLQEKYIKDKITALTKQFEGIEEVEKDVHAKWKSLSIPSVATYSKFSSTQTNPACPSSSSESLLKVVLKKTGGGSTFTKFAENDVASTSDLGDLQLHHSYDNQKVTNDNSEKTLLTISPRMYRNIYSHKEEFERYVYDYYRGVTSTMINTLADNVFAECIENISEELLNIPQSIVLDLYNNEFVL